LKTNEYSSKKVRPKFRKQEPILTRGVMYMHGVKLLEERVGLIRLNSFTRHLAGKKIICYIQSSKFVLSKLYYKYVY